MTTFRRFCCNDLLRIGPADIKALIETRDMDFFMTHLAVWPSNCHVADAPGGRIMGYVMGCADGTGEDRTGEMSIICIANKDLKDVGKNLSNLLDDCCDKIYDCYRMTFHVDADDTDAIYECQELGYDMYKLHQYSQFSVEMKKPLRVASRPPKSNCECGCVIIPQVGNIRETLLSEGVLRS